MLSPEELVAQVRSVFPTDHSESLRETISEKVGELRWYDISAMERVVALCAWGRSGSVLLGSYLDGHSDVLQLPEIASYYIYEFFDCYGSLSLQDKLLGYPVYQQEKKHPLFTGPFAVSLTAYYAAVQAVVDLYGTWPETFLNSRRSFFLFLHIVHHLAGSDHSATTTPLIVYAQHHWDNDAARKLVEDFPHARFLHTVRDPITLCDRLFASWANAADRRYPAYPQGDACLPLPGRQSFGPNTWRIRLTLRILDILPAPEFGVLGLIGRDEPHRKMDSRTRAVRFEDLHLDTEGTMRGVADWLGLPWQASMLNSAFGGVPYVVAKGANMWVGPRPEQAQRQSTNLSHKDRALLFALFYENFVAWNYPCPRLFQNPALRCIAVGSLCLLPMKMEVSAARFVLKRRFSPALRDINVPGAIASLSSVLITRLAIVSLVMIDFLRRCLRRKNLIVLESEGRCQHYALQCGGESSGISSVQPGEGSPHVAGLRLDVPVGAHSTVWALADQAIVSAGNFLTNLFIARLTNSGEYGIFAVYLVAMTLVNSLHSALVIYPLSISLSTELSPAKRGGLVASALLLTTAGCLILVAFIPLLSSFARPQEAIFSLCALMAWQLQETFRRALIAGSRVSATLAGDFISYPVQAFLVLIIALRQTHLPLTAIFGCMTATSVAAAVFQMIQLRLRLSSSEFRGDARRFWHLGRWNGAGASLAALSTQGFVIVLGLRFGASSVANLQSISNVVALTHPVISGIGNMIVPSVALANSSRGHLAGLRAAIDKSLHGAYLLIPYLAVVICFPTFILTLFYGKHSAYTPGNFLAVTGTTCCLS